VAYANIATELCVCIDSDDFMPDDAVEIIVNTWREKGSDRLAGLIGLDCYLDSHAAHRRPVSRRTRRDVFS